jgi:hypothetical protein
MAAFKRQLNIKNKYDCEFPTLKCLYTELEYTIVLYCTYLMGLSDKKMCACGCEGRLEWVLCCGLR